jgi:hypothetical protein
MVYLCTYTDLSQPLGTYYVQLKWSQKTKYTVHHFKHDRYYDIQQQLYRDDGYTEDGRTIADTRIEKPATDHLSVRASTSLAPILL